MTASRRPPVPPVLAVADPKTKGWYLLSKKGVPSLRLTTTPSTCAELT